MKMKFQRTCAVCREKNNKNELLRIVKKIKDLETIVSIDLSGKDSGRGAYICKKSECINQARKKRALERSLSCRVESSVYDNLEAMCSYEK